MSELFNIFQFDVCWSVCSSGGLLLDWKVFLIINNLPTQRNFTIYESYLHATLCASVLVEINSMCPCKSGESKVGSETISGLSFLSLTLVSQLIKLKFIQLLQSPTINQNQVYSYSVFFFWYFCSPPSKHSKRFSHLTHLNLNIFTSPFLFS